MATGALDTIILAIIIGTLAAIVYSLRVLVLMERRVARIDVHIEALVAKIFQEEQNIESEEDKIEKLLMGGAAAKKAPAKKRLAKKKAVRKPAKKKVVAKKANPRRKKR